MRRRILDAIIAAMMLFIAYQLVSDYVLVRQAVPLLRLMCANEPALCQARPVANPDPTHAPDPITPDLSNLKKQKKE